MLRDNLGGLIEPMQISAAVDPLAMTIRKQASDDRPSCLENPRPERAESSLTENATSPFQAEPAHSHLRSTHDVRGHHNQAADGGIGHVEDFIIDDETWAIRYLIIDTKNWWRGGGSSSLATMD